MTVLIIFSQGDLSIASPRINLPTPLVLRVRQTSLSVQDRPTGIVIDGD